MDAQVENAVDIASSPTTSQELKRQAMGFLQQVKDSPDGWQVCLPLFVRDPRSTEIVRMFCLDVLNTAIQSHYQSPQDQSLTYIKDTLVDYMRQVYFSNSNISDSGMMQNKLTQTMTYLFVVMYTTSWPTFFDDILALTSTSNGPNGPNGQAPRDNYQGVMLFLRMTASVHDEVADVLVPRSTEEMQRNSLIKDALRERDVRKLVTSWQEILAQWRGANDEVVLLSLKNIGRWVSWIDISLVVNEVMLNLLYYFLASEGRPRNAAIETLAEIVGKKMKGPDKLDLISFLKLGEIVETLVASPALVQGQENYDFDLAEGVAKLVNGIGVDLIRILDTDNVDPQSKQRAEEYLQAFIPCLLRFFSDEYDEVSQAVLVFMFDLLTLLRKEKKVSGTVSQFHAHMLPPILSAIVVKMKYDVDTTWGDEDEQTDEAEFQELRKKLKTLQDTVASIDEGLYIQSLSTLVGNTFERVAQGGNAEVDWREVETALYEMFLFGELMMRAGGLFVKGQPNGIAAETLIAMMFQMMNSNISSFSHPAVKLRYMEILNRYSGFFETNTNLIPRALEDFVKGVHDNHVRVRRRSWYLFQRFVKSLKSHIGDIAETVLQAIGDLLVIKAEVPKDGEEDEMSSDENQAEDSAFESQLYLFDAVGCLSSIRSIPEERQVMFAQTIMNPLFRDMEKNLGNAKTGNVQAVLQIHHNIMALGTLARGFSDWQPNTTSTTPPSELVSKEFKNAAEAILVSLESLNRFPNIREAARHSFSRMVGVLGPKILPMLPRWIDGLLAANSSKEEMVTFLKLLEQVVHGFKEEIFDILNSLMTPLLGRIFTSLGEETTGTDDALELADLRKEYLSFLLCVLNNDLGNVLISEVNQGIFDQILGTAEHFAKDITDPGTEKLAFSLMSKMSAVYGPSTGQSQQQPPPQQANGINVNNPLEKPLAGFEKLMIERFSVLCWEVPGSNGFNPKDAQTKLVLGEIAGLQKMLYFKLGENYLQYLRTVYFPSVNFSQAPAEEYLSALMQLDHKAFRTYFQKFILGIGGG